MVLPYIFDKGVTFKGGRGVEAESGEQPKDEDKNVPYKKYFYKFYLQKIIFNNKNK